MGTECKYHAHTLKLDKYTVLDTVFKLDWQKSKDKEYMVVKIIFSVSDCSTLLLYLLGTLKQTMF